MKELVFVTGNSNKLRTAQLVLTPLGYSVRQARYDVVEIQGEDTEVIARDKAAKAFELTGKPVVVTDDAWEIAELNGFPGPYMKSMNQWFTPENWLDLTRSLANRQVTLVQQLVYQDETRQKLFVVRIPGMLLSKIRGESPEEPSATVISLELAGKNIGKSIAEMRDWGKGSAIAEKRTAWHELAEWLQAQESSKA